MKMNASRARRAAIVSTFAFLSACGRSGSQVEGQSVEIAGSAPSVEALVAVSAEAGDPALGKRLFLEKGCVLCHSVNSIGGRAGPALDAMPEADADPVAFAARIWRGAPAMVELQSLELGYVIDFAPDELRHLAAFAADLEAQSRLGQADLPESFADAVLDEAFWEAEDWREFLRSGQEDQQPPGD